MQLKHARCIETTTLFLANIEKVQQTRQVNNISLTYTDTLHNTSIFMCKFVVYLIYKECIKLHLWLLKGKCVKLYTGSFFEFFV